MMLLCISFNDIRAQEGQGVYLTWQDYYKGMLTPGNGQCKIKNHRVFQKKYIDAMAGGKNYRYHKDSLFGYRNGKFIYRFYKQEEYLLAEQGEIIIYILYEPGYGPKNFVQNPCFYFSRDAASEVLPLSVMNVKRAFAGDLRLHHYLDMEFYRADVAAYDKTHGMYKINYVLKQLHQIPINNLNSN
jgi:hypothetical protein